MTLAPGTRLGPYEIQSPLGAGGMGEVYRAIDANLGRAVAIKVLPDAFAQDSERLVRFEREAKTLASLNHPHIAQIYGFEKTAGVHALVMELVEGPTLADRLVHGPLPVEEALPIARQIADALEAAHEQGIIHRDLKPANIKVRDDGTVKVLDFGLAKAMEPAGAGVVTSASMSPTITTPAMTQLGMILGTAAYMSPEQAKGRPADKRSDIWAFGCVLFEMLTGRRAFEGEDVSDTLAAVLRAEPDWNAVPPTANTSTRKVLRRCLERDRRQRIADIADVRFELEEPDQVAVAPRGGLSGGSSLPRLAIALVAVAAAAGLGGLYLGGASEEVPRPEMRLAIVTPPTSDPFSFALSPDGRHLAFAAAGRNERASLWIRQMDSGAARILEGTEGAASPFWSPDSRSIGFFANGRLMRIDVDGGTPQMLATVTLPRGASWNQDGIILFARSAAGPLSRVSASGGDVSAVTRLRPGEAGHRHAFFLPDGRRFLFYAYGSNEFEGVHLGSLDSPDSVRLTAADAGVAFLPPDWVLFVRQDTLLAQRLDLERGMLVGEQIRVVENVGADLNADIAAVSASASGLIAFRTSGASRRQLVWRDRSGREIGRLGPPDTSAMVAPDLSPDARRAVVHRTVEGNTDIWVIDGPRMTRVTFEPAAENYPIWSPDGRQIVYRSSRQGPFDLFTKAADGSGVEKLLVASALGKTPYSWSPDGGTLLHSSISSDMGWDLWISSIGGESRAFLRTRYDESLAEFSPDGRWVVYQTTESGRQEINIRPYQGSSGQWQVSTDGGVQPRWAPNGREMFYVDPDGRLMAVSITMTGDRIAAGAPQALFQTRIWGGGTSAYNRWQYDVAPDGRFVINEADDPAAVVPINVIVDWSHLRTSQASDQ